MKRLMKLSAVAIAVVILAFVSLTVDGYAQNGNQEEDHGKRFVDENGDGYNDNAPDHDGDGIPNGQDPDWTKPQDGTGNKFGQKSGRLWNNKGRGFIDVDGDGICDRFQDADNDGIPNCQDSDWVRPQDGTGKKFGHQGDTHTGRRGYGFRGNGSGTGNTTGVCDGTGSKGMRNQPKSSK